MQVSILSEQWVEVQNWFGLLITSFSSLSIPRHFKLIYFGIKITSTQDGEVIQKNGPSISDHKKRLMKNLSNQNDSHLINFDIPDQPNWFILVKCFCVKAKIVSTVSCCDNEALQTTSSLDNLFIIGWITALSGLGGHTTRSFPGRGFSPYPYTVYGILKQVLIIFPRLILLFI